MSNSSVAAAPPIEQALERLSVLPLLIVTHCCWSFLAGDGDATTTEAGITKRRSARKLLPLHMAIQVES